MTLALISIALCTGIWICLEFIGLISGVVVSVESKSQKGPGLFNNLNFWIHLLFSVSVLLLLLSTLDLKLSLTILILLYGSTAVTYAIGYAVQSFEVPDNPASFVNDLKFWKGSVLYPIPECLKDGGVILIEKNGTRKEMSAKTMGPAISEEEDVVVVDILDNDVVLVKHRPKFKITNNLTDKTSSANSKNQLLRPRDFGSLSGL